MIVFCTDLEYEDDGWTLYVGYERNRDDGSNYEYRILAECAAQGDCVVWIENRERIQGLGLELVNGIGDHLGREMYANITTSSAAGVMFEKHEEHCRKKVSKASRTLW
ncbi:MAG: hypothetical protein DWQ37_06125 [Planctomycetota bacterium]|nr:MAG: hypothetical protein DWQ37_06125 [Planctomycetota bacterium]